MFSTRRLNMWNVRNRSVQLGLQKFLLVNIIKLANFSNKCVFKINLQMEIHLTKIVSTLFLSFMFYNFFQLYKLFTPELCADHDSDSLCYSVRKTFILQLKSVIFSQLSDQTVKDYSIYFSYASTFPQRKMRWRRWWRLWRMFKLLTLFRKMYGFLKTKNIVFDWE